MKPEQETGVLLAARDGIVRLRVMTLMYSLLHPVASGSLQAMRKPFGLASPTQ